MALSEPIHASFNWKDFSRFVEVSPVQLGWLVTWGVYHDMGRVRELSGQRTYRDLGGVRRRVADSVFELTRDTALVGEALTLFDRTHFRPHIPAELPVSI